MPTKLQFVNQARKYIGLPHRHQGRAHLGGKNQAVDCVGLLVCAGEDLGLTDKNGAAILRTDNLNYGPQPTRNDVHVACEQRLISKSLGDPIEPGDVITLLVKYREDEPGVTCHVAIISELNGHLGMIHSFASLGRVVEHSLAPKWLRRIEGIFSVPGLT
ncbi:MAG TPA: hypothetical protein VGD60_00770 [Candidatus Acidoferrales bacterium]